MLKYVSYFDKCSCISLWVLLFKIFISRLGHWTVWVFGLPVPFGGYPAGPVMKTAFQVPWIRGSPLGCGAPRCVRTIQGAELRGPGHEWPAGSAGGVRCPLARLFGTGYPSTAKISRFFQKYLTTPLPLSVTN